MYSWEDMPTDASDEAAQLATACINQISIIYFLKMSSYYVAQAGLESLG